MAAKPGKAIDPTIFIIISIGFIISSQFFEALSAPIGALLRAVCLTMAILSFTVAAVVYQTAKKLE